MKRIGKAKLHSIQISRAEWTYCGEKGGGRKWTGKGEARNGMGSFSVLSRCANVAATLRRSRRLTLVRIALVEKGKWEKGREGERKDRALTARCEGCPVRLPELRLGVATERLRDRDDDAAKELTGSAAAKRRRDARPRQNFPAGRRSAT